MVSQLRHLITFIGITVLGIILGWVFKVNPTSQPVFPMFASVALVIGLYGSVVGIDLEALRPQWKRAILIVTLAVPIQIVATGALTYLIFPIGISWLVAVAIDQIDPLSVETLIHNKRRMSDSAKSLLRVWASFDDPVTVIFGFLVLLPLVAGTNPGLDFTYIQGLAANLIPATLLFILMRFLGGNQPSYPNNEAEDKPEETNPQKEDIYQQHGRAYLIIVLSLVYAFLTESYLFAAIAGLLVRPSETDQQKLTLTITFLYYAVVLTVGASLYTTGVDIVFGVSIAFIEFFIIQPISALVFFRGTNLDLLRIAFAQQNGLTTLLMGLAFQSVGFDVLPILIPAIVCINLMNLLVNLVISWLEEDNRWPWLVSNQVSSISSTIDPNINRAKD